jgi:hypothetical protein
MRSVCAVASPKPISVASGLLLSNSVHIRHEQSIGHSFMEMPEHRSFRPRDRDRQHDTLGRLELDNVSAVVLKLSPA